MSTESFIGKPIPRVDGRLKVTGAALYAADHPAVRPAHAWLVKSRVGRGRIVALEVAEAERAPGVLGIWTHLKAPKLFLTGDSFEEGNIVGEKLVPLQNEQIVYHGQTIALVVAETLEQARHAAGLVRARCEERAPAASWEAGKAASYEPPQIDSEPARVVRTENGVSDVKSAFEACEVKLEATYHTPIGHHTTIEPHATVAEWQGDHLTVHNCSQWMTGQQRALAEVLGIPTENVRVICPFVGGAFGSKATIWMHTALAAMAAREVKRPVKISLTREQTFNSVGHRPATIQTLQIGASRDGRINALRHLVASTSSVAHEFIEPAAHTTSINFYDVPNVEVAQRLTPLNVGAPTWMRAPGEAPGMFALESAMDELALALKIDPLQLRLINYAENDLNRKGRPYSSKHLRECYERGAAGFGWDKRNPEPRSQREGEWLIGLGMASASYPGYRLPSTARVRILADGSVMVSSATHDLGTGTYTTMCQVVADELGVPFDKVRAELGDSLLPSAPITGGSMTSASVLPAVKKAAGKLREKLIELAVKTANSPLKGVDPDQVEIENGVFRPSPKPFNLANLIQLAGLAAVEATETSKPGKKAKKFSFYSYGAQFAEVKVHALTGEVRVSRFLSAIDCGRVLNAKTARSQVIGGVVWGIGMALSEESLLDPKTGRFTTADLGSYHIPVNADIPHIDVLFTDKPDTNFNSLGARGVGEIGITGVAAAIANAVFNATGVRLRDLPITPDRIVLPPKAREPLS